MPLLSKILGRRLTLKSKKHQLSIYTGVPALGLDAFASIAYGPEAALLILLPLGLGGLQYFPWIMVAIFILLFILYLSYQQTAAAYPKGGGAYIVVSDNFGKKAGLWAAVSLLIDYFLNVAVGISAGVGAIVSAVPILHPYILPLCLIVLVTLTVLNLRGIQEPGKTFLIPTILFVGVLLITVVFGFIKSDTSLFHFQSHVARHAEFSSFSIPHTSFFSLFSFENPLLLWILLGSFANGLTAMTGIEAVSNAVPLFKQPSVKNAQITLTIIVGVLGFFILCLGFLTPDFHIVAMDQSQAGYQSVLSQLVTKVVGKGIFYYFAMAAIFVVLIYSAQTSFMDFPRVCKYLAEDDFLPHFFYEKGRRLVFTYGILVLAFFSGILLILFKGNTQALIPLFAIGAFSAFLFSQAGMLKYWLRYLKKKKYRFESARRKMKSLSILKLTFNFLGALVTAMALIVIILAKFVEGAWVVILIAPLLVYMSLKIKHHYTSVLRKSDQPLKIEFQKLYFHDPIVLIPVSGWNTAVESAMRFALLLSKSITAIYVEIPGVQEEEKEELKMLWKENIEKPAKKAEVVCPKLEIIHTPYSQIYKPLMDYIRKKRKMHPHHIIAIIIPEVVEPHWYEIILHDIHTAGLRAYLFFERDPRIMIITVPWYLR